MVVHDQHVSDVPIDRHGYSTSKFCMKSSGRRLSHRIFWMHTVEVQAECRGRTAARHDVREEPWSRVDRPNCASKNALIGTEDGTKIE